MSRLLAKAPPSAGAARAALRKGDLEAESAKRSALRGARTATPSARLANSKLRRNHLEPARPTPPVMRPLAWLAGVLLPMALAGCLQDAPSCAVPVADKALCDARDAPAPADVQSITGRLVDGGLQVSVAYFDAIDPNTYYYGGRATVAWTDASGVPRSGGWNWIVRPPANGTRDPTQWEVGKHFVACGDTCFYGGVQQEVAQRRHPATFDGRHLGITLRWLPEAAPPNIVHGFHEGLPGPGPIAITELEAYTGRLATAADGPPAYAVADFHHWLHYVPACILDEAPDDQALTVWKHGQALGACETGASTGNSD